MLLLISAMGSGHIAFSEDAAAFFYGFPSHKSDKVLVKFH